MCRKPPRRHREDIKSNAFFAAFRISAHVPLRRSLDAASLTPGDRFDGGGACGAGLDLDGDQFPATGRENVDFTGPGSKSRLKHGIALEPKDPDAQFFGEAAVTVSFLSFSALMAHEPVSRNARGGCELNRDSGTLDLGSSNGTVTQLPSWLGLLTASA